MKCSYSEGGLPFVDITLSSGNRSIVRQGLVDSGSTINVLPYEDGLDLGLVWEDQRVLLKDEGFLKGRPVYAVLLQGKLSSYPPVNLAFA